MHISMPGPIRRTRMDRKLSRDKANQKGLQTPKKASRIPPPSNAGFITCQSELLCSTSKCHCAMRGGKHESVQDYAFILIPNYMFEGSQWIQKDNWPHDRVTLRASVGVEDHKEFRYPVSNLSCLCQTTISFAIDSGCMATSLPPK